MKKANENNLSIIRIYQKDVMINSNNRLDLNLLPLLKKIKKSKIKNHYIADDKNKNLYDMHKKLMENDIEYENILYEIIDIDIDEDKDTTIENSSEEIQDEKPNEQK